MADFPTTPRVAGVALVKTNDARLAAAADLATHLADTSDAHDASAVSYAGGTGMSATDVEAAIDELATEKADYTAWSAFTPTWTASVSNPAIGNGTLSGRYALVGKILFWSIVLSPGTTTTFGSGTWKFAIPPGTPAGLSVGNALAYGTGPLYLGQGLVSSVIEPLFSTGIASASVPQAWANGTPLVMSGSYEIS